ncbi:MAG: TetR/AcrR family transcriptional regulator [Thermodesulfobacteriota bacterium]|nr:TetR/AcrR family transcriptional regulator [Thermodesulfobacteriota bacterium]
MYSYKSMNAASRQSVKGKRTREKILTAGKKTFTRHPYSEASVRKMQQAGDFNYALIRYYFGSKKGLFEAVAMDLSNECIENASPLLSVFSGTENPIAALREFITSIVDFYFDNPEGPSIIMLNIGAPHAPDAPLPGITAFQQYIDGILKVFRHVFPVSLSEETTTSWAIAFCFLSANAIGAAQFHAAKIGLEPDSTKYREWTKEATLQLFEPVFEAAECGSSPDTAGGEPMIMAKNNHTCPGFDHAAGQDRQVRQTKGEMSRKKILEAARRVFTRYPYNAASIRKIGREGGFDFTLVHHYFPTKRSLVEALAENFHYDFFQMTTTWLSEVTRSKNDYIDLYNGFKSFIDHCVAFYFNTPSAPALIMQNIGHPEQMEGIPGFKASKGFYEELNRFMKDLLPVTASRQTLQKWHYCLTMLINTFIGTPGYPARLLNMDPEGPEYRQWVKTTLTDLFYPSLRQMVADR